MIYLKGRDKVCSTGWEWPGAPNLTGLALRVLNLGFGVEWGGMEGLYQGAALLGPYVGSRASELAWTLEDLSWV